MHAFAQILLVTCLAAGSEGLAFRHVAVGDGIENESLRAVRGPDRTFLEKGRAGLFLFFSPEQQYSQRAVEIIAQLQKELADRPLSWAVITSDRHPIADIESVVGKAELASPVLLDRSDALYGRLGGKLTPVIGIVDREHRLVAYLPFQKVNYESVIRAWLRRTLGELSDSELQAVLNPEAVTEGGEAEIARRHLKMGERLLRAEDFDGAAQSARKSLEHDEKLVAAHVLLGTALARSGRCAEAVPTFDKALQLEPGNAAAMDGKADCALTPRPSSSAPSR